MPATVILGAQLVKEHIESWSTQKSSKMRLLSTTVSIREEFDAERTNS